MKRKRLAFAAAVLPAAVLLLSAASSPRPSEVRAVWVTRFDYKNPADAAAIIANCARAGMTDVFFQIRGNGTVFYPSRLEPWGFEMSGTNVAALGTDPGWDPLQTAVVAARRYGIRLHAYINVLPGWRGRVSPPPEAGQLWTARPEWFMTDTLGGRMQSVDGWYAFLNPSNLEVRRHLAALAAELAQYDLAGLHLDYIRFPYDYKDVARRAHPQASPEEIARRSEFSYDRPTVEAARRLHGPVLRQSGWDRFRRDAVSQVVMDLNQAFKSRRGGQAVISASVLGDFDTGYRAAFQDSRRWAKEGMVDWLVPMNYTASRFDARLKDIRKALGRRTAADRAVIGINCAAEAPEIRRQIEAARKAGCRGFALFAYSHLFEGHQPTQKARALLQHGL